MEGDLSIIKVNSLITLMLRVNSYIELEEEEAFKLEVEKANSPKKGFLCKKSKKGGSSCSWETPESNKVTRTLKNLIRQRPSQKIFLTLFILINLYPAINLSSIIIMHSYKKS